MLGQPLEPALEHAAMFAAIATRAFTTASLPSATGPLRTRRLLTVLEQGAQSPETQDAVLALARSHFEARDPELARTAIGIAARNPRGAELCRDDFMSRLRHKDVAATTLPPIVDILTPQLAQPAAQSVVTAMLDHPAAAVRQAGWRVIARHPGNVSHPAWLPALEKNLSDPNARLAPAETQLLLDAVSKVGTKQFDAVLQGIMKDPQRPQPVRLKALAALSRPNQPLVAEAFTWLLEILQRGTSTTARVDAARFLTRARLTKEQLRTIAPVIATAGPMELTALLAEMRKKIDPEIARLWAEQFVRSPLFASFEESVVRTNFQALSTAVYEQILGPAARAAAAETDAKKRKLESLVAHAAQGRPAEGARLFATSACAACHKIGEVGRAMGPDLSRIGQIRQPRDLLESILFPNATIAQEFETFVVETADGQNHTGTIKRETADALVLVDLAGQEKSLPLGAVVGRTALPTSAMPIGLEQALSDQQLLDLVAWLGTLK